MYGTSASELGELKEKLEDLFKVICEIKGIILKALVFLIRTKDDSAKLCGIYGVEKEKDSCYVVRMYVIVLGEELSWVILFPSESACRSIQGGCSSKLENNEVRYRG